MKRWSHRRDSGCPHNTHWQWHSLLSLNDWCEDMVSLGGWWWKCWAGHLGRAGSALILLMLEQSWLVHLEQGQKVQQQLLLRAAALCQEAGRAAAALKAALDCYWAGVDL